MPLEPGPLTSADADAVAGLMARIAEDHPTGFELAASEVRELLGFATSSLDVDTANPTGALGIYERAYSVRHRQDNYTLVE